MSDQDYAGEYEGAYQEPMPGEGRPQSNVLGIVGFVLAFCVSPIGLLVSLFALTRPPRGFAIAGVVVGLLGTIVWGVLGAGIGYVLTQPIVKIQNEVVTDYMAVDQEVEAFRSANDRLPASLDEVTALNAEQRTDPWGNPYVLEPAASGDAWSLRVTGPDGQAGTGDDLVLDGGLGAMEIGFEFPGVQQQWNEAAKEAAAAEGSDDAVDAEDGE